MVIILRSVIKELKDINHNKSNKVLLSSIVTFHPFFYFHSLIPEGYYNLGFNEPKDRGKVSFSTFSYLTEKEGLSSCSP